MLLQNFINIFRINNFVDTAFCVCVCALLCCLFIWCTTIRRRRRRAKSNSFVGVALRVVTSLILWNFAERAKWECEKCVYVVVDFPHTHAHTRGWELVAILIEVNHGALAIVPYTCVENNAMSSCVDCKFYIHDVSESAPLRTFKSESRALLMRRSNLIKYLASNSGSWERPPPPRAVTNVKIIV